jgi:magnesium transporter
MITVYRWTCSDRTCERVEANRLPASAADVTGEDVLWVDLAAPTPDEEQLVFERFLKVHRLSLEDITKPRREAQQGAHLPKVEEFPDYLFVIVNPLPKGLAEGQVRNAKPSVAAGESARRPNRHRPQLSAVLTTNVLVTHHYELLDCVDEVQAYVDRHGETTRRGPDFVFHLILDAMVDDYAPVVDRVSARLDRLEARIFRDPSPAVLQGMLRLKRLVTGMRKTLILEREVLARLTRGEFALVNEREIAYYRNVYDHLVRYTELIEAAREMVGDLMQTHLSASSNRLNAIMKVLTMISTVILPMTLIAGVYGMNFEQNVWPNFQSSPWGFAFALGLMVLTGIGALVLFRWLRWL